MWLLSRTCARIEWIRVKGTRPSKGGHGAEVAGVLVVGTRIDDQKQVGVVDDWCGEYSPKAGAGCSSHLCSEVQGLLKTVNVDRLRPLGNDLRHRYLLDGLDTDTILKARGGVCIKTCVVDVDPDLFERVILTTRLLINRIRKRIPKIRL